MGVRLAGSSQERESEFFLALDPRSEDSSRGGSEPVVRVAIGIARECLEAWMNDRIEIRREVRFDEDSGKARCTILKKIHHLVISESDTPATQEETRTAFAEWVSREATAAIQVVPEVCQWLARYRLLRNLLTDRNWPAEPDWAEAAQGWASGCVSLAQMRHRSALGWVQATLPVEAVRLVTDEVPESIELPNGRTARIDYDDSSGHPCISGRVQDFFGWKSTPAIVLGRVPLLLEILAPNQRPVQRTLDLESFWNNTYPQVRKDLRGRYPKHHWPEDPWNATAGPSIRRGSKS
jgi:ATP-dependent helicase HrpB